MPVPNQYAQNVRKVWYTSKTINATAASRTACTADLAAGDIVLMDPYVGTTGRTNLIADPAGMGDCYAWPENGASAAILGMPQAVVIDPGDVNLGENANAAVSASNPRRAGWITVATGVVSAKVDGTTDVAIGDGLILVAPGATGGAPHLAKCTTSLDTDGELRPVQATALEARTTNSVGLQLVLLGGLFGNAFNPR